MNGFFKRQMITLGNFKIYLIFNRGIGGFSCNTGKFFKNTLSCKSFDKKLFFSFRCKRYRAY